MNKNTIWVIIALVIIGIGVYMFTSKNKASAPAATPATTTQQPTSEQTQTGNAVEINNFAFSPASITVKVGDSVIWTNKDSTGHSVTADDGAFDTGVFDSNSSKTLKFDKAGTFTYHCKVHPSMKGTVVVE